MRRIKSALAALLAGCIFLESPGPNAWAAVRKGFEPGHEPGAEHRAGSADRRPGDQRLDVGVDPDRDLGLGDIEAGLRQGAPGQDALRDAAAAESRTGANAVRATVAQTAPAGEVDASGAPAGGHASGLAAAEEPADHLDLGLSPDDEQKISDFLADFHLAVLDNFQVGRHSQSPYYFTKRDFYAWHKYLRFQVPFF